MKHWTTEFQESILKLSKYIEFNHNNCHKICVFIESCNAAVQSSSDIYKNNIFAADP